MRVLVTGASGFIGRHLVSWLSAEHEVFALQRTAALSGLPANVSVVVADLNRSWNAVVLPPTMDAIIHLAQANVQLPEGANELFAVGTIAAQRLLDYARLAGVQRFIFASSGDVYGYRLGLCRESDIANPDKFYAATKYASELLVRACASYLKPCILRLFHPYGPGQRNRIVPRLAEYIRNGQPIRIHKEGRPYLTPIYVDDVVHVLAWALESNYGGVMNVAGDALVSVRILGETIGRVLRRQPHFTEVDGDTEDKAGAIGRMKGVVGAWPMVGLYQGLVRTFAEQEAGRWRASA